MENKTLQEWSEEYPEYLHDFAGYDRIEGRCEPGERAPYGYWVHKKPEKMRWYLKLLKLLKK